MSNKKFSEFTEQTDNANVGFVAGFNGSTNVRISPANIVNSSKKTITAKTGDGSIAATERNHIITFNTAGTARLDLPDSGDGSQVGMSYEFITTISASSGTHTVKNTDTSNEVFVGSVLVTDTSSTKSQIFETDGSDNFSRINMAGDGTGGLKGTRLKFTNLAADLWFVEGILIGNGNPSTPFATS